MRFPQKLDHGYFVWGGRKQLCDENKIWIPWTDLQIGCYVTDRGREQEALCTRARAKGTLSSTTSQPAWDRCSYSRSLIVIAIGPVVQRAKYAMHNLRDPFNMTFHVQLRESKPPQFKDDRTDD